MPTLLPFVPTANLIRRPLASWSTCITVVSNERTIPALARHLLAEQLCRNIQLGNLRQIVTVNNDGMSVLSICYMRLEIGSQLIKTDVYIMPQISQMILGADLLAECKLVTWDFEKGRIQLGTRGEWVPLRKELSRHPFLSMLRYEHESELSIPLTRKKAVQMNLWMPVTEMEMRHCIPDSMQPDNRVR